MADITPTEQMAAARKEAMNQVASASVGRRSVAWGLITVLAAGFGMVGAQLDRLITIQNESHEALLYGKEAAARARDRRRDG